MQKMTKKRDLTHKKLPVYSFFTAADFHRWISANQHLKIGFWLHFYKTSSNKPTVQYPEAVEEALCYGWIDGLFNSYDAESYLVRFTPRRSKSVWSKLNVLRVEKLIANGRMQPNGLAQVELAKNDGRWAAAYSSKKS